MNKFLAALLCGAVFTFISCNDTIESEKEAISKPTAQMAPELITSADSAVAMSDPETATEPDEQGIDSPPQVAGHQSKKQTADKSPQTAGAPMVPMDHRIIKHANLSLQVASFNSFFHPLRTRLQDLGCYIAAENQVQDNRELANTVSIRVPVAQFESALGLLTSTDAIVKERSVTSQDVTVEIVDTRSRIESRKKVRDRYLQLLEKAKSMDEVLTVQTEINEVQEQVEAAMGRRAWLSNATAYSTIDLKYFEVLHTPATDEPANGIADRFYNGLAAGWSWFADLVVRLLVLWPIAIMLTAGIMIYKRSTRKPVARQTDVTV